MKRFLKLTMLCLLLSMLAVPVYAEENQLENAIRFFQNAADIFNAPFELSASVDGQSPIVTAETVLAESDESITPALEITADGQTIWAGPRILAVEEEGTIYGLDLTTLFGRNSALLAALQQNEWYDTLMNLYESFMEDASDLMKVTILPFESGNTASFSVHFDVEQLWRSLNIRLMSQEFRSVLNELNLPFNTVQLYQGLPAFLNGALDATAILSEDNDCLTASLTGAVSARNYGRQENFNVFFQFSEPENSETQPSFQFQARIGEASFRFDGENGILTGSIWDEEQEWYQVYGQYGWHSDGARLAFEFIDVAENTAILTVSANASSQGLAATVTAGGQAFLLTLHRDGYVDENNEIYSTYVLTINYPGGRWNLELSPEGLHSKFGSAYRMIYSDIEISFTDPGIKGYYFDHRFGPYVVLDTYYGRLLLAEHNHEDSEGYYVQYLFDLTAESRELNLNYYEIRMEDQLLYDTKTKTFGYINKIEPDLELTMVRKKDQLDAEYMDEYNTVDVSIRRMASDWEDNLLKTVEVQMTSVTEMYEHLSSVLFGR